MQRWLLTQQTYDVENPKRVYYLSMEFLIGRTLVNNIINLGVEDYVRSDLQSDPRQDWTGVIEAEPDAGLGNGGLGRLAACLIDPLATLQIPAVGYGLRYEYGIFRQDIANGHQVEHPDYWLTHPDPWEVGRPDEQIEVPLNCSFRMENGVVRAVPGHASKLLGIPFDRPVVGYGGRTINTLRLWQADSPDFFDFGEFSSGDFVGAIVDRALAETVTRVLYPDDSTTAGQALRFLQEYFLVCCSLGDVTARFRRGNDDWRQLPEKVAIQLNDTHPAMAVAELMRILLDQAQLGWDEAWDLTIRTLAYTNHTLLPEALERWSLPLFADVLPRHLEIVYEINRRFLDEVRLRRPGDEALVRRASIIGEEGDKTVRMAHLASVGCRCINGVSELHTDLLKHDVLRDFHDLWPEKFVSVTNGVTPRRWVRLCNPSLAALITEVVGGDGWLREPTRLAQLERLAGDAAFHQRWRAVKRANKERLAALIAARTGIRVDPASLFDVQVKRIHEYKRQHLNVLHVIALYNRLRRDPSLDVPPRTVIFGGKAAPGYFMAKPAGTDAKQPDHDRSTQDQSRASASMEDRRAVASDKKQAQSCPGRKAFIIGGSGMKTKPTALCRQCFRLGPDD